MIRIIVRAIAVGLLNAAILGTICLIIGTPRFWPGVLLIFTFMTAYSVIMNTRTPGGRR